MSLSLVRPFIRTRLNELGFQEWPDGFNTENIPETLLDKAYHIATPSADFGTLNHHDQPIDLRQELSIFRKGFRDPAEAIDTIIGDCEDIVCDLLDPENRFDGHLNIVFRGFTIEPLNDENDNSVKAVLSFDVVVTLGVS
jgi:hypothetical protein